MTHPLFSFALLTLLALTLALFALTRLIAGRLIRRHHAQKCDFFRHYPIQEGDIVFIGDSLTDGARWDELFPGRPVKNRGINADTTLGVLQRLDEILEGKPAALFILIATNNLPWYVYHNDEDILETYARILKRCREGAPQMRVYVQSLLPRARSYAKRIQSLNQQIEALAARYACTYINLFPHFADPSGALRRELTNDHLHLMAKGYQVWADLIRPWVDYRDPLAKTSAPPGDG